MREIADDPFYAIWKRYRRCGVEYGLLQSHCMDRGEPSHREALAYFLRRLSQEEDGPWSCDIERARAVRIDGLAFFYVPDVLRRDRYGNVTYDCGYRPPHNGGRIPYWYAFLEPPQGGGAYAPEDFQKLNRALFPAGMDALDIYEWTTDWSDYFDDGHEWWGAACWTVYDRTLDRYAVLLASATD